MPAKRLPATPFRLIVERLALAVFVFRDSRVVYSNQSAQNLLPRLRTRYDIEMLVALQDHLSRLREEPSASLPAVTLITTRSREPFYIHVIALSKQEVAVTVRELGGEYRGVSATLSPVAAGDAGGRTGPARVPKP